MADENTATTTTGNTGDGGNATQQTGAPQTETGTVNSGVNPGVNPDGSVTLQLGTSPSDFHKQLDQFVPETQKTQDWYKNLSKTDNPVSEFWKQWENREKLIGKQVTVNHPGDNGTPEDWARYRKQMGIPDNADEYNYTGLQVQDNDPDKELIGILNQSRPEPFVKACAAEAHRLGITPKQFAAMNEFQDKQYIKYQKEQIANFKQEQETRNADVAAQAQKLFGARLDKVKANADTFMAKIPDNIKALAPNMDANSRLILAAMFDAVHQHYVREDNVIPNTSTANTTGGSGGDWEALRQERLAIMSSSAYNDPSDANHKYAGNRVKEINTRMRQLETGNKK